jgi:twitching motility protein PilT
VPRLDELGLPEVIESFAHLRSGLVLVTGPTGSGKSSTLAAVIDKINTQYYKHIITLEDPIELRLRVQELPGPSARTAPGDG